MKNVAVLIEISLFVLYINLLSLEEELNMIIFINSADHGNVMNSEEM